MAQAKAVTSPTVRSRRLGVALQKIREDRKLTLAQVGSTLKPSCSASRIQRIEAGITKARPGAIMELLELYEVDLDTRRTLLTLAETVRQEGWWWDMQSVLPQRYLDYIGFESEASRICVVERNVFHGLLQTRDYALAIEMAYVNSAEEREAAEQKAEARLARQGVLDRADPPLRLVVVLDEAVLHRVVGSQKIQREQLRHVIALVESHPNVTLQVVPFAGGYEPGFTNSFAVLFFPDPNDRDVAFCFNAQIFGGDRMLERPEEIQPIEDAFNDLRGDALDQDASVALMRTIVATL